MDITTYNMPL